MGKLSVAAAAACCFCAVCDGVAAAISSRARAMVSDRPPIKSRHGSAPDRPR